MLASIRDVIVAVFRLLPWAGTGAFLYVVLGGDGGIKLVYTLRDWLKTTKSVAQDQSAEIKAIKEQLAILVEASKPKV